MATDRLGNEILSGFNVDYTAYEIENVNVTVSNSETTESVYVRYTLNDKNITVRFSNHVNNAVSFGDQLDGNFATLNEIKYRLGLLNRTFIPKTRLMIETRQVKKIELCLYKQADLTIKEMYDLGKDADLSEFIGKLAKGSNYLIIGDKVDEFFETRTNILGQEVKIGNYIYHN